jgi:carbon storage regulator
MIGDNIEVTVVEIRGDRIKLGFVGPHEVPIHREEVYRRIEQPWQEDDRVEADRRLGAAGRGQLNGQPCAS